ncbi:MAG: FAD-binding protein [Anaerolineales bacterium]|nr:FAD-binding protein [Anaerolineales bacterium]NUQ85893.1 FAD-binding protein [Anaerolineales bacterium]
MSLPSDFINELTQRFTGDVRLDSASRILYSTDASIYQVEPTGVVIPKTQDDLHVAVELAAKYAIPILPRGAGTSLAGQAIGNSLILDCSRWLDNIIEMDPDSHTATVEPGVVLADLNSAAAKFGLTFGPDPASAERATMGGVIGNNATGAHSILYGMSADHLLEADVILSDGSLDRWGVISDQFSVNSDQSAAGSRRSAILSTVKEIREKYAEAIKQNYPKTWRNSAGYRLNYLLPWSPSSPPQWSIGRWLLSTDRYPPIKPNTINLAPLLAGSEGTLAVIRRMKVGLMPKPKHTILCVLAYRSIAEACDDAPRLLEFGPSAIELIPRMILELARSVPAYARQMGWVSGLPAAVLIVEFSGDQPPALKEAVRGLDAPSLRSDYSTTGTFLTIAESKEEQAQVWNVRKVGLGILDSRPQAARPVAFIEDCVVPVERLGEYVREVERILAAHGTEGGIYAHVSAGCLHIRPILDLQKGEGVRALRTISEQVFALVMRLDGAMSSEHGDGIARGEYIERTYGREVTEAMRSLKRAADPENLLNPGKLFDAPPMDSHLRFGEGYRVRVWKSALHFDHERGLAGGIEQCNGQGVCRKMTGVMCPSFQATREEGLSTRGRANLLRELSKAGLENEELVNSIFSTLDLCLACKGCTSECPSGVDMPRLKYEFMNEYYKTHRRRLRDYLFGYFHVAAKWLTPIAPLANLFMKKDWSRRLIARRLGIAEEREFPLFAGGGRVYRYTGTQVHNGEVIFLSDVFSHYIEPEVEEAAIEILSAVGYGVKILPTIGAGASLLSKGFIEAARGHAKKVLGEIQALDGGAGSSVVGCEPPEVYCLKHEYRALLPGRRAEVESIAKRTWLVEEFALRVASSGKFIHSTNSTKGKVIFHPHCHQRAEGPAADGLPGGTNATVELLRLCGYEVDVVDAGCCGMAGTFGFEAEHYDLSMRVGERLFKSEFRNRNSEIVSSGAACRMQIRHGMGVEARHPLILVRDALREGVFASRAGAKVEPQGGGYSGG